MNKHQARFHIIRNNKRKQSKKLAREEKKQQERINKDIVLRNLVNDYIKNIPHFFPNLMEQLMQITDFRERPQYDIAQIVFSAIALFFFKATSRNAFNNLMSKRNFANNFKRAFGFLPPHFDTVALVMEKISNDDLEKLKSDMVIILIEKKIFYKYKVLGRFYNVAFDGSGVGSINPANLKNFPKALRKKYKSGITKFYLYVLEAKLICRNGLAVSIGSEWILNEKEDYDKQDCLRHEAVFESCFSL